MLAVIALVVVRPSTGVTVAIIGGLVLTIMLHEWGHYVAAKRSGMKVTEFFLGFGPRIWSFRRGETEYGIKAIPAGGYVRIIGMTNLEEVDPEDSRGPTGRRRPASDSSPCSRASSSTSSIALVLVFGILVLHGPEESRPRSTSCRRARPRRRPGSAPAIASSRSTATRIDDWDQVGKVIRPNKGNELTFTVVRDGQDVELTATPKMIDGAPRVGISAAFSARR